LDLEDGGHERGCPKRLLGPTIEIDPGQNEFTTGEIGTETDRPKSSSLDETAPDRDGLIWVSVVYL
jgi:hypothetical protein